MIAMQPKAALSYGWRCWIAENVLLGVCDDQIASRAAAAGLDAALVSEELQRTKNNPYIEAGRWVAQRLRKQESMLQIRVEVARQNGASVVPVPVRRELPADKFRRFFYARNRPVKLSGMIRHWPAMAKWNPNYLRETYGSRIVEVTASRSSDPKYEINLERHRRQVRFADFIDLATSPVTGNDSYLVANNRFFRDPQMAGLLDDVGPFPGYLKEQHREEHTYLWFGPAGTVTPLHHDTVNILFFQIYGRKRIVLIPPDETPWLYNELAVYSEVDFENPDLERYPLFQHVSPVEVIAGPGDALFIPVGWWHHVRSLETSISVSSTNFVFPNDYHWLQPHIQRSV
jgi:hypothetical protein